MDINLKVDRPGYPIGSNMDGTTKLINAYIHAFNRIGYGKDNKLNLWCRGSSGAILAAVFCIQCEYECRICHIKKEQEDSHNGNSQPYDIKAINVVIDDFVGSGNTIASIVEHIQKIEHYSNGKFIPSNISLDVLMVLDWEDAPLETTIKFKHRIGKRI